MTLKEMADLVCSKLGKTDAASIALCKRFIDQRYQLVFDAALWRDSQVVLSTAKWSAGGTFPFWTLKAGEDKLHFPPRVERVLALRRNPGTTLGCGDVSAVFASDPSLFERTGQPVHFTHLPPTAAPPFFSFTGAGDELELNFSPSTVSVYSASPADIGPLVSIKSGISGDRVLPVSENLALNGTSPVTSSAAFFYPITMLSKPVTGGIVNVAINGSVLVELAPWETHQSFTRVRVHPIPAEDTDFLALCKLRKYPLKHDNDTPLLSNCEDAVMALAQADMLERFRQYGKAREKQVEAAMHLDKLRDLEKNQTASVTRIIPVCEPSYFEEDAGGPW